MKLTPAQRDLLIALNESGGKVEELEEALHETAYQLQEMKLVTFHAHSNKVALHGKGKMPVWAIEHFPSNPEDCRDWHAVTWRNCLHRQVMCVAQTRIEGMWKAYIGPVPGMSHDHEEGPVLEQGNDVGETIALVLFPHMKGIPYAR